MAIRSTLAFAGRAEDCQHGTLGASSQGMLLSPIRVSPFGLRGNVASSRHQRFSRTSASARKPRDRSEAAAKLAEEETLWEQALEEAEQGAPENEQLTEYYQAVSPEPAPSPGVPQRALIIGGFALLIGAAAVGLWNSQWLRLPWQKRRVSEQALQGPIIGQQPALPLSSEAPASFSAASGAVTEDVPPASRATDMQEQLAEQRMQAAEVVQRQRHDQFTANRERVSAAEQASRAGQLLSDPLADVAPQQTPPGRGPKSRPPPQSSGSSGGRREAPPSAPVLPELSRGADPNEEALLPKASDINFIEKGVPSAETGPSGSAPEGPGAASSGNAGHGTAAELSQPEALVIEEEAIDEKVMPSNGASAAPVERQQQEQLLTKPKHVRRSQQELPQIPGQLRLVAGGVCMPSQEKAAAGKSGEDSFFVSGALWGAVGIADGVGSWMNEGVDPALYSRRLMETAEAAMKDGWGRLPGQGARGLMHLAQAATADVEGTSTVCVALMQPGCTLQAANLGDSGFRIFRDGECIFASEVQQHSFNCPYQAGSRVLHPSSDCANSADVYEIVLAAGDMLIMATDGIFDNLWDSDLEKIVVKHTKNGRRDETSARSLAGAIVKAALARGQDENVRTPWVVEAAKHAPDLLPWHRRIRPRGGKPDDCTAIVAFLNSHD